MKNCEEYRDTLPIGRQVVRNFSQLAAEILVKYGKWFFKDGITILLHKNNKKFVISTEVKS